MSVSYSSASKPKPAPPGQTEFEILKATHKFLREDDADDEKAGSSWDEKMAAKYYASLYREFAVCDLKHYKSGEFALRWRTENEVLSGAGETTCGNTRCKHHEPPSRFERNEKKNRALTTLELPFAYEEHGENKSALVKVVLCEKCLNKLMWKRRKAKELQEAQKLEAEEEAEEDSVLEGIAGESREGSTATLAQHEEVRTRKERRDRWEKRRERDEYGEHGDKVKRRRRSRSRSPKRAIQSHAQHDHER
ncbi:hypothetical protein AAF712_006730 [Marasmius tenuissimus]|uniref:Protein FRA10AC1 n=1 Tax=Marasmius tenuissimus TaxID=585030 RepID=A0ABR2ZZ10_9AGAR